MMTSWMRRVTPLTWAHAWKLKALKLLTLLRLRSGQPIQGTQVRIMGLTFPNRCGVACGIDSHGDFIEALATTGAAYLSIGPITPKATRHETLSRLRRAQGRKQVLHRGNLYSKGLAYLGQKLATCRFRGILALTLSKQPETTVADAVNDFRQSIQRVYPYANFLIFDLTWLDWQAFSADELALWLHDFLLQLKIEQGIQTTEYHRYVPLVLKIRPDLPQACLHQLAKYMIQIQYDGILLADHIVLSDASGTANFAGAPTVAATQKAIFELRQLLPISTAIIAEGGNIDIQHAACNLAAGADLLAVYSGWFLGGEGLYRQLARL